MRAANYAPVYAVIYPGLAELCRESGYALSVHGSMARDFDLVAVPWTTGAAPPTDLIDAIVDAFNIERIGGIAIKEHARMCQTLAFGGECFFDLSIMPRRSQGELAGEVLNMISKYRRDPGISDAELSAWIAGSYL